MDGERVRVKRALDLIRERKDPTYEFAVLRGSQIIHMVDVHGDSIITRALMPGAMAPALEVSAFSPVPLGSSWTTPVAHARLR